MWIAEKMQKEVSAARNEEKRKKSDVYLQEKLAERYEFRYNMLTGQVEYRMKEDSSSEFCILDKRMLFTLCLEMRESGISCWDKDLQRYIFSSRIDEYHPMREYFSSLPQWDGRQRVMHRVNPVMMGRELTAAGVEKEHRRDGNYYLVVRK